MNTLQILYLKIAAGIVVWIFVSQFLAHLFNAIFGTNTGMTEEENTEWMLTLWGGIFMFIPLMPFFVLIYLIVKARKATNPFTEDPEITADDIIP